MEDQHGIMVCLPEEPGLLVCSEVTFHALKAAQTIMECLCCRVDCQITKRFDGWWSPTLTIHMFNYKHVICESLTKSQILHAQVQHDLQQLD